MNNIENFNNTNHRIESASAVFQKGLYHLFILMKRKLKDPYERIIRIYQCLFQINLTQLLLDFDYQINSKHIPKRLKCMCRDPKRPTREDIDPASLINHSVFENNIWKGFPQGHPMHKISKKSIMLYKNVVGARHNLLYRPFLLNNRYWEDCTLISLLERVPQNGNIEEIYKIFIKSIMD
ncbi:MAG: hypothetical protein ABIH68_08455 [bacterium]